MRLHFDRAIVEQLLKHATEAPDRALTTEDPETKKPGLWLVGDHGVYLMSNGAPPLLGAFGGAAMIASAVEADAHKLPFDQWWKAKQESFGPDDGVEFIDAAELATALATYRPGEALMLDVTPQEIRTIEYAAAGGAAPPIDVGQPHGRQAEPKAA